VAQCINPNGHKDQGCQIFSGYNVPKTGLNYQMTTKLPNGRKIVQIAVTNTNVFHFEAFQNLPKLGYFVCKSGNLEVTIHIDSSSTPKFI
jgi:hypothetical protein